MPLWGVDGRGDAQHLATPPTASQRRRPEPRRLAEAETRQLLFGHVDPSHDGLEVDQIEEVLIDGDVIAQVDQSAGDDAGDRRSDLGVAELAASVLEGDLELLDLVGGLIHRLLTDQLLVEEILLPLVLTPGLFELALDPCQVGLLLVVLEPHEDVAAGDGVALLDQQLADQPRRLGEDLDLAFGLEVGGVAQHRFDRAALEDGDLDGDALVLLRLGGVGGVPGGVVTEHAAFGVAAAGQGEAQGEEEEEGAEERTEQPSGVGARQGHETSSMVGGTRAQPSRPRTGRPDNRS